MLTGAVKAGLLDELRKIAAVSVSSLSPQTALNPPKVEPMNTLGMERANQILDRLPKTPTEPVKTAAERRDVNPVDRALVSGAKIIGGAGVGRMLSDMSFRTGMGFSPRRRTIGTLIGGAAGVGEHLLEPRLRKHFAKKKTSAAMPPGFGAKKVGKFIGKRLGGPSIHRQISGSLLGRTGTLPSP